MFTASKTHVDSAYQVSPVMSHFVGTLLLVFGVNTTGMNKNPSSFINNMLVPKQDLNLILNTHQILNFDWCGCQGNN